MTIEYDSNGLVEDDQVDNTSDADKPISTAMQEALDDIEALAIIGL